jgi:DNA (cytosine-5)-methyltransferase 1
MANRFPEKKAEYPLLIADVREPLRATGLPYVIENVMGARADMESPVVVCGRSLDLGVQRHRLFETNFPLLVPPCVCGKGDKQIVGVYGQRPDGRRLNSPSVRRIQYAASSLEEGQVAMGIDWMPWRPLTQAIPPAYTELIGAQLLDHLRVKAAA